MHNHPIPPRSFRDPNFIYRRAEETNIRETFARIRAELEAREKKPIQLPYTRQQ